MAGLQTSVRFVAFVAALTLLGCASGEHSKGSTPLADSTGASVEPRTPLPDTSWATTASDVVRGYYAAIESRDYRRAFEAWADSGAASAKTFEQFARGFAETAHASVEITGPEETEGAAGSIYARVPVVVHATTTWGANQSFVGTYTLKRVNDVPGATPDQLRWHIRSANLKPSP